jgi:dihydrofolate reductase
MISIICAVAKNRAIGRNNQLLWHLPDDLKHFKKITTGHTVIMGQKTYESIGQPLPNRKNIVVTRDKDFQADGCVICHSLEDVLKKNKASAEEVFIIGGGEIYRQSFPFADKLYITLVDDEPNEADTFFPDYSEFSQIASSEEQEHNGIKYKFIELTKK